MSDIFDHCFDAYEQHFNDSPFERDYLPYRASYGGTGYYNKPSCRSEYQYIKLKFDTILKETDKAKLIKLGGKVAWIPNSVIRGVKHRKGKKRKMSLWYKSFFVFNWTNSGFQTY